MRFVLTAQAWVVVLRLGRPAAQTLGRYKAGKQLHSDRKQQSSIKRNEKFT